MRIDPSNKNLQGEGWESLNWNEKDELVQFYTELIALCVTRNDRFFLNTYLALLIN